MSSTSTIHKKVKLQPVHDKILIRVEENSNMSDGGIIIPDSAIDRAGKGIVIAVGPGRIDRHGNAVPMCCAVGDRVMFFKMAGREITIAKESLVLISEPDIDGVITEEEYEEETEAERQQ
jgi:chaperonin GroES